MDNQNMTYPELRDLFVERNKTQLAKPVSACIVFAESNWYRLLRERTSQTVQLSMFDAGMDLRNERPLPPEVPDRYMVPTGKYPDRLNGKWDGLIFDPTI